MNIRSIFSVPATANRVSFLHNGSFAYRGYGYAYIIRPTPDGASATLRISKALLTKFINAYWPKTQQPKMKDMVLTESGFGWWRVHSLSEVGDASVHLFFRYLNLWVLAQQRAAEAAQAAAAKVRRCYTLTVERVGNVMQIISNKFGAQGPQTPAQAPVQQAPVAPKKLELLAKTINGRFGHLKTA